MPPPKAPPKAKARLFVEADLATGTELALSAGQARYLNRVMRLGTGDPVAVFNGRDGEWLGRIAGFGRGWCALAVAEMTRRQHDEPDLWLAFAPVKKARTDFIVEKATELGASRLWPVFTRRTAVRRVNVDRLRANAIEAAEQCGRLGVPEIAGPATLEALIAAWPAERRLLVLDESGGGRPIAEALSLSPSPPGDGGGPERSQGILIGPEGGFAPAELDALRNLPFVTPVGLGPRLLRTETAALSALACWQALIGDWRDPSLPRTGH